jgi:ABC-2 type transport system ATP-binding protein
MSTIEVNHITKNFASLHAVDDVSFSVEPGEIFGLLGPNGAGKTTSIRIILDIFKPDSGSVNVLGGPLTEEKKDQIGYLPEERGLYQDIPLDRCLVYLATLKGLAGNEARRRVDDYLLRFELDAARHKKIRELSKGMQQKAQLIATLVHRPNLVIIDEPFSALDPVNTQMVKDLLLEQRAAGVTIVMCTHQMHQVEELCDRLVLINHGQAMLYGKLAEIRRQFASQEVILRTPQELPAGLLGAASVQHLNGSVRIQLQDGVTPQDLLRELVARDIPLEGFEIALPTLDQIFIQTVQNGSHP